MPTWPATIIERKVMSNAKGEYLEIKLIGEDGKTRERKVFGDAVKQIPGTGAYEIDYEKDGKFWNIVGATLLSAAQSDEERTAKSRVDAHMGGRPVDENETYRNDAITAQVCIKTAGDITIAAISKATEPVTAEKAKDYVTKVAEGLIVSSTVAHVKATEPKEEAPF